MEAFTLPPTQGCLLANSWSSGSVSSSPPRVEVLMVVFVRGDTVWLGACVGERTKSVWVSGAFTPFARVTSYQDCRVQRALLLPNGRLDLPWRLCSWLSFLCPLHCVCFRPLTCPYSSESHSHIQHYVQCRLAEDSLPTLESIVTQKRLLPTLAHLLRIAVIILCAGLAE
jgi:hypothetical protein